jgi:hypothetical protein
MFSKAPPVMAGLFLCVVREAGSLPSVTEGAGEACTGHGRVNPAVTDDTLVDEPPRHLPLLHL